MQKQINLLFHKNIILRNLVLNNIMLSFYTLKNLNDLIDDYTLLIFKIYIIISHNKIYFIFRQGIIILIYKKLFENKIFSLLL